MTARFSKAHRLVPGAALVASLVFGLGGAELAAQSCAIPGRDGPASPSGVVNSFYPGLTGTVAAGSAVVPIGAIDTGDATDLRPSTPIAAGDLLIVMQMQDAVISTVGTDAYGDGVSGGRATGVQSLNNAGRYEYCVATGAAGGASVPVNCGGAGGGLQFSYSQQTGSDPRRTYQVIRVPQYSSVNLTGTLLAPRWNGQTGGVLAIDVAGRLTLDGLIEASGRGFRGAGFVGSCGLGGSVNLGRPLVFRGSDGCVGWAGGSKGEGIAGTPLVVFDEGSQQAKSGPGYRDGSLGAGAPGNAGGGGEKHKAGGGGGGNGGRGGRGGNEYNGVSPTNLGAPKGGYGGDDFSNSEASAYIGSGRVVLGGGGGAGDSNDYPAVGGTGRDVVGGAGGGIVLLRAGSLEGGGQIRANGSPGSGNRRDFLDAAGGGGAGGSVVLEIRSGAVGSVTVRAEGGRGGDFYNKGGWVDPLLANALDGPGGGGGGGLVLSNASLASVSVVPGDSGKLTAAPGLSHPLLGSSGGAEAGAQGVSVSLASAEIAGIGQGAACLPEVSVSKLTSTPLRVQGTDTTATYTITAANGAGRGTAYGVALVDDLPAPFTASAAAITPTFVPAGCGAGPASVSSAVGDPAAFGAGGGTLAESFSLPGGCGVSLTFDVVLNAAANGTYQNPARVLIADPTRLVGGTAAAGGNPGKAPGETLASGEAFGGLNYEAASSTAEDVIIGLPGAELSVTKVVSPVSVVKVGDEVTFTITVSNGVGGLDNATGVAVRDVLPAGLEFVRATPSQGAYDPVTGIWTVGALARAATATLSLVAKVKPSGSYQNTAEVSASDQVDPDPNNNRASATVQVGVADLSLTKTVAPGSQNAGAAVSFTLTLSNAGPDGASGVEVTDLLPSGYSFVAARSSQGTYDSASGKWAVGAVSSGVSATLTIDTLAQLTGEYTNVAEVTASEQTDPDSTPGNGVVGEDDRATATPTIIGGAVPVIGAAKSVAVVPAGPGVFDVTYRVTVQNIVATPSIAYDVQVNDDLSATFGAPVAFVLQAAPTATGGLAVNPAFNGTSDTKLLAGTSNLSSGTTAVITFTVRVTANGALGPFDNQATATAATLDGGAVTTTDLSDNGTVVDANGNGIANEAGENDKTPVRLGGVVTGAVFEDVNGNGIREASEPGLPNIQVQVTGAGVTTVVTTDASGAYSARNVPAGPATADVVDATLPAGSALTAGPDPRQVSVLDGATVDAGAVGFQRQGLLNLLAFNDVNGNGVREAGEAGIAGVSYRITESDGTLRSIVTGAEGTASTTVPAGSTGLDVDEATLPAGATLVGGTDPVTIVIAPATSAADIKAYQFRGTLTGRVFRDNNGNGSQDAGEPGFPGLPVTLLTSTGQTLSLVTGPGGDFAQAVPVGPTTLRLVEPVDFVLTTSNDVQVLTVSGGLVAAAAPVGFAAVASIGGGVWRDLDSDRSRDGNEPGLSGWRIDLLNPVGGAVVKSAVSDSTGEYRISGVTPARTYLVRFTSPTGAVFGTGVNGENGNPQAGSVVNAAARSLEVTPVPGASITQQSLPVDPQGVVYDTLARSALSGARVTLSGPAGFSAATHLLGGVANATQLTGSDGGYQFLLLPGAPAGAYTLTVAGPSGFRSPSAYLPASGTLDPTGQGSGGVLKVQAQPVPPPDGQPTTHYLVLDLAQGDPDIVNNHIPLDPPDLQPAAIRLRKRVDRATATVGGLVAYTITLENTTNSRFTGIEVRDTPPGSFSFVTGSVRLDGKTTGFSLRGPRPLVFSGIDLAPGQRRTLRYVLRVGAGVVRGEYPNTASPFFLGFPIGNTDVGKVAIVADPVFDESTIIGKVFNDRDGDGWQDPGEDGVPGVRLATVEGLMIETDAFGRYHIAAVDGGFMERGRNFIVKLDPASLPPGSSLTTDNPRVSRVTPGLMSRFDFGVKLVTLPPATKRIDLKLAEVHFERGSAELASEFRSLMAELADRIRQGGKAKITVKADAPTAEGCSAGCELGRRRVESVKRALVEALGAEAMKEVEVVADYTGTGGTAGVRTRPLDWIREAAFALLAALVPAAHAAPCAADACDGQSVEVRLKQSRTLAEPGVFWATEDAGAPMDPRLAVEGPDRLPVVNGTLDGGGSFALYTNYSSYIDRFEVRIFAADRSSYREPLAVIPVAFLPKTLRNLLVVEWNGGGLKVGRAEALDFVVRAIDSSGRIDETQPRRMRLLPRKEYDAERRLAGALSRTALSDPSGAPGAAGNIGATPLRGRFLLLKPGVAALVDPVTRRATEAAAGLSAADATFDATARPIEGMGLADALPRAFTRKSLLGDLQALDDLTLEMLFGRNDLSRRAIPVRGSRVRVSGQRMPEAAAIRLNGQVVPVDAEGRLVYETFLPVGRHELFLDVVPEKGDVWPVPLAIDVTGQQMFMVGIADLTLQKNDISGSVEPLSGDDRYLEDTLAEGRVALFLKGKIRGKYLLTTQLDSKEEQLDEIVGNLDRKDPRRLFRNIDPDKYYPVYGDDSTTIAEANTQGRLYARVQWDNSQAVVGNFNTNFNGTEFAEYNRTLYGANVQWKSLDATKSGQQRSQLAAFASEAETALGHDEFLGTGGSLYYLRHSDVVEGSAKGRLEIVDRLTERTLERIPLVEGVDYEIDELQGRLIMSKPLLQVARQRAPTLVRDGALDGDRVLLVVDYEYLPAGFQDSAASYGLRGRHWLGEALSVGGTLVDESRDVEDYRLAGADVELRVAPGSYLKAEYAQTEATQAVRYFSTDGGLSFAALNPQAAQSLADDRSGEGLGLEARFDLNELGLTDRDWSVAGWWKRNDDGFAVARRDEGFEVESSGFDLTGALSESVDVAIRASSIARGGMRPGMSSDIDRLSVLATWTVSERDVVAAEIQSISQQLSTLGKEELTVAAVSYRRTLSDAWDVQATVQAALDDGGSVSRNSGSLVTLGTRYALSDRWAVDLEATGGEGGSGVLGSLEYRVDERQSLYGAFTHSADTTERFTSPLSMEGSGMVGGMRSALADSATNSVSLGSRWQLSDQTRVFAESQFSDSGTQAGLGHLFGLDFAPREGWRIGSTLQRGEFDALGGVVERDAASLAVGFTGKRLNWATRAEYRLDDGVTQAEQYLVTNRVDFRLRDSFHVLGKANVSQTTQDVARLNDGQLLFGPSASDTRFVEASIGLAHRRLAAQPGKDRVGILRGHAREVGIGEGRREQPAVAGATLMQRAAEVLRAPCPQPGVRIDVDADLGGVGLRRGRPELVAAVIPPGAADVEELAGA